MKNKITSISLMTLALVLLTSVSAVSAEEAKMPGADTKDTAKTVTSTTRTMKLDKATTAAREKGGKEIDNRVADLTKLLTRINEFKNLPDAQKSSVSMTIQGLVAGLNNLKQDMETTESTTTLKADLEAITSSYRIYALVMPQIRMIAAADRSATVVNMLTAVSAKLEVRLSQATGLSNMADLEATLADLKAKIAEAKTMSDAVYQSVVVLVPDQGDKTKMAANNAVLKEARTKLKTIEKNLIAARKDAGIIIKALGKETKSTPKTASSTPTTSNTASSTSTTN